MLSLASAQLETVHESAQRMQSPRTVRPFQSCLYLCTDRQFRLPTRRFVFSEISHIYRIHEYCMCHLQQLCALSVTVRSLLTSSQDHDSESPASQGSASPGSQQGIKRKRPPQLFIPADPLAATLSGRTPPSQPRLLSANFDTRELTRDHVTLEGTTFALSSKRGRRSKTTNEDAFQVRVMKPAVFLRRRTRVLRFNRRCMQRAGHGSRRSVKCTSILCLQSSAPFNAAGAKTHES